jgi:SAM-dependent methyltransferase
MTGAADPDELREELLDAWDRQSRGWGRQADRIREVGMPVSERMLELAALRPGERVLELAAGPGDTGLLAAARIAPGGTLISSDASEPMLALARERAAEQGIDNVEFRQLQLEWIDLPTAAVDAILCRWGLMLAVDPAAALSECRRVLRPGGRVALAVWDAPGTNPWTTILSGVLVDLGLTEPPAPGGPGMFALASPGTLEELLGDAGFLEVTVEPVAIERRYASVLEWIGETHDCSIAFAKVWSELGDEDRRRVREEAQLRAAAFTGADGVITLPGSSLVALAAA